MGGGVSSSSNHPVDDRKLKCINPKAAQAQKIYESDGLATTLSALGGGGKEVKLDYIRLKKNETT